jgi:hypothetical protein
MSQSSISRRDALVASAGLCIGTVSPSRLAAQTGATTPPSIAALGHQELRELVKLAFFWGMHPPGVYELRYVYSQLILTEHPDYVNPNYVELDGRAALYYQAAGASKSILLDVVGAGSKYAGAFKDSKGDWLMGDNNYRLHVPANVPAKDFWSVTVYDAETRSMIDTDQSKRFPCYAF